MLLTLPSYTETMTRHTHVLASTSRNRLALAAVAATSIIALYLTGLTRMGMYSTDEPRYADIGRAMARSGDWITPRLWGQQLFFEKPPLLYWMTATGFKLGLGDDLAPRLPVALLSVGFLVFFWLRVRRLFDAGVANCAAGMLATSAGWLAYSHVAVTDLPVTVFFSTAMLLSLRPGLHPGATEEQPARLAAAIALGLAVLAKSIPPLVLFLPILVTDRRNWRRWFAGWPMVAFIAVALPWHVIGTIRNGWDFPYILFVQQQFGRFLNSSRQHGQPWWFYGPCFLVLLFPWFPLLPLSLRHFKEDARVRNLAAVIATGLVFFSASVNKLPGYVLPLVPATCVLMGLGLSRATARERWLISPIAMLGLLPLAVSVLPEIAAHGYRATPIPWSSGVLGVATTVVVGAALAFGLRSRAFPLAALLVAAGFLWTEIELFPALDRAASARTLWSSSHPGCSPVLARGMLYGLYYYSGEQLPDCAIVDRNAGTFGGNAQTRQLMRKTR